MLVPSRPLPVQWQAWHFHPRSVICQYVQCQDSLTSFKTSMIFFSYIKMHFSYVKSNILCRWLSILCNYVHTRTFFTPKQGCGSATRFRDCSTKKKIKKTCSQQPLNWSLYWSELAKRYSSTVTVTCRPVARAGI